MNAPGKGILKVTSILYIIFGSLLALVALLSLVLGPVVASVFGGFFGAIGGMVGIVLFIVFLILAAIDLVAGIIGIKQCGDPSKALFFIIFGFIVGGLTFISLITDFSVGNIVGLVMPVLFIVGGFLNKKAAV
jgi:hypothetical protein